MENKIILLFVSLLFFLLINSSVKGQIAIEKTPVNVDKYYSEFLSNNLNYTMQASKILYHLSKEKAFDKEFFLLELNRIENEIGTANYNISKMVINTPKETLPKIDKYLKSIDQHLAQVTLDIDKLHKYLKEKETCLL